MRALQMARVAYSPARAYEIAAQIGLWSRSAAQLEMGPGVDQADAVELAVHLTILRGICTAGTSDPQQVAWFNQGGTFMGVRAWGAGIRTPDDEMWSWLPIYGEERFRKPRFGSGQLGPAWSRDLALGLGTVLDQLVHAEQGPNALPEWTPPGGVSSPAMVQCVVAGPAVRIMKNPAPWRYLDQAAISTLAYVGSAASAFETRLRAEEGSGIEIPPTPIELAAADRVRRDGRPTYNREALIGGGTVVGTSLGVTLLAAIRSRAEA